MENNNKKINRDKYIGIFGIALIFISMAFLKSEILAVNNFVTILIALIIFIVGIKLSRLFTKPLFDGK